MDILEISAGEIITEITQTDVIDIGYVSVGGSSGGGLTPLEINFASALTTWSMTHSFNHYPIVVTMDQTGEVILGDVTYPTATSVRVDFAVPITGKARLY